MQFILKHLPALWFRFPGKQKEGKWDMSNGKGDTARHNRPAYREGWKQVFGRKKETRLTGPRPRIYISGPITLGDQQFNLEQAIFAQKDLMASGFAPLNPMLTMLVPGHQEIDHETRVHADLPWVEVSDGVLRLPGASVGADEECEHAEQNGVPVFYSLRDCKEWFWGYP
jgi:hypothetical protein